MSTIDAMHIKAKLGFRKTTPTEVLARATAVYTGIKDNPADYPAPIPDLATFKGEIDTLAAKIPPALDGSKKAIAERNHQVDVVIHMLRLLGHYVESACKGDMPTLLKSGSQAASTVRHSDPRLRVGVSQ